MDTLQPPSNQFIIRNSSNIQGSQHASGTGSNTALVDTTSNSQFNQSAAQGYNLIDSFANDNVDVNQTIGAGVDNHELFNSIVASHSHNVHGNQEISAEVRHPDPNIAYLANAGNGSFDQRTDGTGLNVFDAMDIRDFDVTQIASDYGTNHLTANAVRGLHALQEARGGFNDALVEHATHIGLRQDAIG